MSGDTTIPCAYVHDHLAEYCHRREQQAPFNQIDRLIAAHLQTCTECHALLDDLEAIQAATLRGTLPAAAPYPRPDLSFLQRAQPVSAALWSWVDERGHLVIQFSEDVLATLPSPPGRTAGGQRLYHYANSFDVQPAVTVAVDLVAENRNSEVATVIVQVTLPSRAPCAQAGTPVHMSSPGVQFEGTTDTVGRVVFAQIPRTALASLRVQIVPPRTTT